jgi:hypothetical protein
MKSFFDFISKDEDLSQKDKERIALTIKEHYESGNYRIVEGIFSSRRDSELITKSENSETSSINTGQPVFSQKDKERIVERIFNQHKESSISTVFLSYSRDDSIFVDHLEKDLSIKGYTCWVDRSDILGGQNWARKIEEAIDSSTVFIVVLSPSSTKSRWVQLELSYALYLKKLVIPIIYKSGFKIMIEFVNLQTIDFSKSYNTGLGNLIESLVLLP